MPSKIETHSQGSFRFDLLAGFLGKIWFVAVALACTPYFLHILGPEGYGLVGFFLTLQRLAVLLDSGFSTTINREMAQHAADGYDEPRARDILKTLGVVYWGLSLLVLGGITIASDWIAAHWINIERMRQSDLSSLIGLMGFAIAVQLPLGFYSAALQGMQRHVLLNTIQSVWQGTRFIGAVIILLLLGPSLFAFFGWLLITGILVTLVMATCIWRCLPRGATPARFRPHLLREVSRFTAGAGLFTVTAALIVQMDKVVLSKMLSCEEFGYYMLAFSLASTLFLASASIFGVMFPILSKCVAQKDMAKVSHNYHLGSQLMTLAIIPAAATGAFFCREIISTWLGDPHLADQCHPLGCLLFCGIGINCLSSMPHALQMANGWTRLAVSLNVWSIVVLGPFLCWACSRYGAIGAGLFWILYGTGGLLVQVGLVHRVLLRGERLRWCRGVLLSLVSCAAIAGMVRIAFDPTTRAEIVASTLLSWGLCTGSVLAVCPLVRKVIVSAFFKQFVYSLNRNTALNEEELLRARYSRNRECE